AVKAEPEPGRQAEEHGVGPLACPCPLARHYPGSAPRPRPLCLRTRARGARGPAELWQRCGRRRAVGTADCGGRDWPGPGLPLPTDGGDSGLAAFMRGAQPVLLDLTADGRLRAAAAGWTGRVQATVARSDQPLEGILVRPDGYVAWAAPPASAHGRPQMMSWTAARDQDLPADSRRDPRQALACWHAGLPAVQPPPPPHASL